MSPIVCIYLVSLQTNPSGTLYRGSSQKTRNLLNIKKQKQPRTTYTSELRQRSLSVAKDLFLDTKIQLYFEFPKALIKKLFST